MSNSELNAVNLKKALWGTLGELKSGECAPAVADSIAAQAREIIRTCRVQLNVLSQAGKNVSKELVDFSAPE